MRILRNKKLRLSSLLKRVEKLSGFNKFYKEKFIKLRENMNGRKNLYILDWWTINYNITLLIFCRNLLCKYRLYQPYYYRYVGEYVYIEEFIEKMEKYILHRLPEEYESLIQRILIEFKVNCETHGKYKDFLYYESSDGYREKILSRLMLYY